MPSLEILREAERRGILKDQDKPILAEARRRGLAPSLSRSTLENIKSNIDSEYGKFSDVYKKGGVLDTQVLSGQLPIAGTIGGGVAGGILGIPAVTAGGPAIGGVVGAGLGGAGGQNLQDVLRSLLKLDNAPQSTWQAFKNAGLSGMSGAISEAGGQVVSLPLVGGANPFSSTGANFKGLIPKTAELISSSNIPRMVRGAVESLPGIGGFVKANRQLGEEAAQSAFNAEEAARKSSYDIGVTGLKEDFRIQEAARKAAAQSQKKIAQEAVRTLPDTTGAALRVPAGQNLSKAINIADTALQENVGKVVNPIISKSGSSKISVEPVRQQIVSILKDNGMVDDAGNILASELDKVFAPERKQMLSRLIQISENLVSNPTVSALNRSVKDLQSLANFGSAARSAEDKVFGSLSRTAKEALYDGVEQVAGGQAAKAIRTARKVFSENQPIFDTLREIASRPAEQIVDTARNALPGTFIVDTITKQPALKKPIGDVVLNDIARSFSSPKTFQTVIDKYGRDSLQKLFSPDVYKSILTAESALQKSAQPFVTARAPVPIPFVPGRLPEPKLGWFWQKQLNLLNKGETLTQPTIKGLFQAIGRIAPAMANEGDN